MIEFNSSSSPTIGVEIELQLIDDKTFSLNNIAPKVLRSIVILFVIQYFIVLFKSKFIQIRNG